MSEQSPFGEYSLQPVRRESPGSILLQIELDCHTTALPTIATRLPLLPSETELAPVPVEVQ